MKSILFIAIPVICIASSIYAQEEWYEATEASAVDCYGDNISKVVPKQRGDTGGAETSNTINMLEVDKKTGFDEQIANEAANLNSSIQDQDSITAVIAEVDDGPPDKATSSEE